MPVVRPTPLQDSEPRLLHEVVNSIASAQQGDEITNKPVLVLLDQHLEDSDIALAQPTARFVAYRFPWTPSKSAHNRAYDGYTNQGPEITNNWTIALIELDYHRQVGIAVVMRVYGDKSGLNECIGLLTPTDSAEAEVVYCKLATTGFSLSFEVLPCHGPVLPRVR